MSDVLVAALTYAARGWSVIPLHHVVDGQCSCGSPGCESAGKHPIHPNWSTKPTRTLEQLTKWWDLRPKSNVGIRTGHWSGFFVLDVDGDVGRRSLADLPAFSGNPAVRTGSGGAHYYFEIPPGCTIPSKNGWRPGIDIRGDGGQVVAPPSVSGKGKYVDLAAGVLHTPDWLVDDLTPAPPKPPDPVSERSGHVTGPFDRARYRSYCERAAKGVAAAYTNAPRGQGERALYAAVSRLIELYNADWNDYPLDWEPLEMARRARVKHLAPNGQTEEDFIRVVASARRSVGDRAAPRPQDGIEIDGVVVGGGAPASTVPDAPLGSTSGTAPESSPSVDQAPRIKLTPASKIGMQRVRWLWHDRIPLGEITLVAGREGVGKSTYLADLAAKITTGKALGEHEDPRTVLYIAAEDSWAHTIAPRLHAAGANMDKVFKVDHVDVGGLILPRDCEELAQTAREAGASAVMLDPIISLIDDKLSTDRARELRQALEPLRKAAERACVAVIGLVHFNKNDGDVLTKIAGSRGWVEVARSVIGLAKDKETGQNVLSQVKNNLGRLDLSHHGYDIESVRVMAEDGEAETSRIVWTGKVETSVEEILDRGSGPGRKPSEATVNVKAHVLSLAAPTSIEDIAAAFPMIKRENMKQILRRLAQRQEISHAGHGLYGPA